MGRRSRVEPIRTDRKFGLVRQGPIISYAVHTATPSLEIRMPKRGTALLLCLAAGLPLLHFPVQVAFVQSPD